MFAGGLDHERAVSGDGERRPRGGRLADAARELNGTRPQPGGVRVEPENDL
jgi:hypothetical protein